MKVSSRPDEAQMLGQPRMLGQLPVFAVDRHEVARPHQVQHQLQFFHAAVSGNVQRRIHAAVHHIGAAPRHVVDHAVRWPFRCRE